MNALSDIINVMYGTRPLATRPTGINVWLFVKYDDTNKLI
jgi:hypothetical protein